MLDSLRARMLLTAAIVLVIFLGLVGFVLDGAFRTSAAEYQQEKMQVQVYGLLAVSDILDNQLLLPEELQEPGFNNMGTGLYGVVLSEDGDEVWRSPSALDLELSAAGQEMLNAALDVGARDFGVLPQEQLFYLRYQVRWELDDFNTRFIYVVLENQAAYQNQVMEFRNSLWLWLLAVVGLLVVIQFMIMSWGLSPLGRLASDLKAIEDGDQESLSGEYPTELSGVADNLNLLIASERQQRERYRTTMADLAHSLKTPLAILQSSTASLEQELSSELSDTVHEQIGRMDDIISYQLERAVTRGSGLSRQRIEVQPVVERLTDALSRIYQDASIKTEVESCEFIGDERDLFELCGNLLDNACKYGAGSVRFAARAVEKQLEIVVEDNGPGIDPEQRELVLDRGTRLDSQAPGQGIGLSIVHEVISRYDGEMSIEDSDLGGTRIRVKV